MKRPTSDMTGGRVIARTPEDGTENVAEGRKGEKGRTKRCRIQQSDFIGRHRNSVHQFVSIASFGPEEFPGTGVKCQSMLMTRDETWSASLERSTCVGHSRIIAKRTVDSVLRFLGSVISLSHRERGEIPSRIASEIRSKNDLLMRHQQSDKSKRVIAGAESSFTRRRFRP